MENQSKVLYIVFGIAAVVVVAALATYYFTRPKQTALTNPVTRQATTQPSTSQTIINVITTCVPHRIKSTFSTMECVSGVRSQDGKFYTLNVTGLPNNLPLPGDGTRLTIRGKIIPDQSDSYYDVSGRIEGEVISIQSPPGN